MKRKPTGAQIADAVAQLEALKYFPTTKGGQKSVMTLLARMVGTEEQLAWLVQAMLDEVGEWHGTSELRGVFCTQFKPADGGAEPNCVHSARFTTEALQEKFREAEAQREELEWKKLSAEKRRQIEGNAPDA